ncbi:hypothetical protein MTO96_031822 [Rhipicephalus appendiculatus]
MTQAFAAAIPKSKSYENQLVYTHGLFLVEFSKVINPKMKEKGEMAVVESFRPALKAALDKRDGAVAADNVTLLINLRVLQRGPQQGAMEEPTQPVKDTATAFIEKSYLAVISLSFLFLTINLSAPTCKTKLPRLLHIWQQQDELFHQLRGCSADLASDGRCYSPGFSAKFMTYSLHVAQVNRILHFEQVQVGEMKHRKNGDEPLFYMFYRMSPDTFDVLHSFVREELTKDQCPSRGAHFFWRAPRADFAGTHSIVLMAVADSQYLFRLVNVGAPGRFSDGEILQDSPIGERLHEGKLSLPRAATLPRSGRVCLHVFVGDEAFQLRPHFMRPLPGSRTAPEEVIYNYRLSRARRCVKNAFSILVSRWQIYERQINMEPERVEVIVKATCVLQNFLSSNAASTYCPSGYADFQDTFGTVSGGAWRQGPENATMFGLEKPKARNCAKVANAVRQQFIKYFSDEGQVPWQWKLPGVAPHQASTSG